MKTFLSYLVCLILSFASYSLQKAPNGCSNVKGLCKFFYEKTGDIAKQCIPIPRNRANGNGHCTTGAFYHE
jgi:hypothetical protein